MNKYPSWVCSKCGLKALEHFVADKPQYARYLGRVTAIWHKDKCDVCQETKSVTEPRDFFYPPLAAFEFKP